MKRQLAIILTLVLSLSLLSGCGKEVKTSWQEKIDENAKADKYTLLYIDEGSSSDTEDIKNSMVENTEKLSDQFAFAEVDYTTEKDSVLEYLKTSSISEFPLILTIAPSGLITRSFKEKCTEDELMATIVSEKEEEVYLSMQKGLVSLLCINSGETEKLSDIKESLKSIETNYSGAVAVYYLDTTNEIDKEFIDKQLPEATGDITVMIILPTGSIVGILSDDELTLTNLMAAIQSGCSSGSCGTSGCN